MLAVYKVMNVIFYLNYAVADVNKNSFTKYGITGDGGIATWQEGDLIKRVVDILNFALGLVGLAAVVVLIWGGIQYMTAGGDETKVESATKTITNALIGLAIVILSGLIVNFVIGKIITPGK